MATDLVSDIRRLCLALPGVTERLSHGAPAFFVTKQFVMLWPEGHHERAFPHLWCAAGEGVQAAMIDDAPDIFFRPPYVGSRGWLGVRLESEIDHGALNMLIVEAYRVVAPKDLVAQLDAR